jgi:hypothetical protein
MGQMLEGDSILFCTVHTADQASWTIGMAQLGAVLHGYQPWRVSFGLAMTWDGLNNELAPLPGSSAILRRSLQSLLATSHVSSHRRHEFSRSE